MEIDMTTEREDNQTNLMLDELLQKGWGIGSGISLFILAGVAREIAWSLLKTIPEELGLNFQIIEESPKRVVVRAGRCSIYEAAQALGIDNKSIETMCKFSSNRFDASLVKQLNPSLSYRVRKFRSSADDFCEEEITLE
jgi:hypothetical protein